MLAYGFINEISAGLPNENQVSYRILIYEFMCANSGSGSTWPGASASLLREGLAMLSAIATDLSSEGHEVVCILHRRWFDSWQRDKSPGDWQLGDWQLGNGRLNKSVQWVEDDRDLEVLGELTSHFDWTIVIAPEIDGVLLDRVSAVELHGGRLLSPGSNFVRIASDKWETNRHLAAAGIPVPRSFCPPSKAIAETGILFPAVLKPRFGAGSMGMKVVDAQAENPEVESDGWVLEPYISGTAASVSCISGPNGFVCLEPTYQTLSSDGSFGYLGGRLPMPLDLAQRARLLGQRVAEALPLTVGYWGVDVVLGPSREYDVVIEVNPRLTTSYVGLRRICQKNLATAMIEAAEGGTPSIVFDRNRVIQFSPDGSVTESETSARNR